MHNASMKQGDGDSSGNFERQMTRGQFLKMGAALVAAPWLTQAWAQESPAVMPTPERGDSLDGLAMDQAEKSGAPFLLRGTRETKKVAVTFDDGPTPAVTEQVLAALEKYNAKATFFMIGRRIKEFPSIAKKVLAAGHEPANHSYTHPTLGTLPKERVEQELQLTQQIMLESLGVTPRWFRPPYGSFKSSQMSIAHAQKLGVVIWSVDPRDWSRPGVDVITDRILRGTSGGDIVLCHDLHAQTGQAAERIIGGLVERGLQPVTLSELILS